MIMVMMNVLVVVVFQYNFMNYIYKYIALFCELTPSAGIAASWASAGSKG